MREKIANKEYLVFLILLLVSIVFSVRYSPFFERLGSDKEVFQYIGMLIKNGHYPYTHAFDHKPPVIYLINYLGCAITPNSTWGVFFLLNTIGFFCSLLVYKIASTKLRGYMLPILITVAFIMVNNSNIILQEANLTRQVTAYLTTIILFIVFATKKSNFKIITVGFFVGLIFFTQQNEILSGLVVSGYFLLFKKEFRLYTLKTILQNVVFFLFGLLIITLGILFIIYYWGNFDDFLNQVFLFNFNNYIENRSAFSKIVAVVFKFAKTVYANKILLVISLVLIFSLVINLRSKDRCKVDYQLIIMFIALIFQMISSSISGKEYGHYFLMIIPYLFCVFIFSLNQYNLKHLKYISFLLIVSFIFQATKVMPYQKQDKSLLEKVTKEVRPLKNKHGQFYSLNGRYLRVNFNLNIIAPTKHIYAHFIDNSVANKIIEDLKNNNTKYILYDEGDANIIPNSLKFFIATKYKIKLEYQDHILYELN